MLKDKQVPWLQITLVLIFLLLLALVKLGDSEAKVRTENQRLNDKIQKLEERIETLDKTQNKLEKEIKKLKSSKATPPKQKETALSPQNYPAQAANYSVGKEYIVKKIQARFGTDPRILTLVNCESGFSPTVVSPIDKNGHVNVGLFQINMCHGQTIAHWQNIDTNIQKAWELSKGGTDWSPWPTCKYTAGLI